jgi:hypothetical protein
MHNERRHTPTFIGVKRIETVVISRHLRVAHLQQQISLLGRSKFGIDAARSFG